ncbi:hypothetical protein I4F81_012939 [Pyropia yezoensis]|uniref:Uncharacterized protein n=1 Tax=Pyropia yezoensis TaxID=2788 RepID=A0ABQ9T8T9_PYRYE|nr:hypothetical protein I4F81_012939 [Neopyropia yezoensis]
MARRTSVSVTSSASEPRPAAPLAPPLPAPLAPSVTSFCCKYSRSTAAAVGFLVFLGLGELASISAAVAVCEGALLAGLPDEKEELASSLPVPAPPSLSPPMLSAADPPSLLLPSRSSAAALSCPSSPSIPSATELSPPVLPPAGGPPGARPAAGEPGLAAASAHMSIGSCTVCWVETCDFLNASRARSKSIAPPNLIIWSSLWAALMPVPLITAHVAIKRVRRFLIFLSTAATVRVRAMGWSAAGVASTNAWSRAPPARRFMSPVRRARYAAQCVTAAVRTPTHSPG